MVRLGNFINESYFATADWASMHNHDTGTSSDALYNYGSRFTNKVAYRTPSFSGATLEVARSFGEGVAGQKANWDVAGTTSRDPCMSAQVTQKSTT